MERIDNKVEPLEEYRGRSKTLLHKCLQCGYVWSTRPTDTLRGKSCRFCARTRRAQKLLYTHERYVELLTERNHKVKVIEQYHGNKIPILHECLCCQYQWKTSPRSMLQGQGCPKCAHNLKFTTESYQQKLRDKEFPYVILEEYKNNQTSTLHLCEKCGLEWKARPSDILQGKGCPSCAKKDKCSKGEQIIKKYLEVRGIQYHFQYFFDDCAFQSKLPFDFFLPEYNVCIEYDGEHHYQSIDFYGGEQQLKIQQQRDKVKNDYCFSHGILLIRIPYWKTKEINIILDKFLCVQRLNEKTSL